MVTEEGGAPCTLPPAGWICSRGAGHEGPCAATPAPLPALTREKLERMQCGGAECDHRDHPIMFLHARCHPSHGTRVVYVRGEGRLTIACKKCESLVAHVRVGD